MLLTLPAALADERDKLLVVSASNRQQWMREHPNGAPDLPATVVLPRRHRGGSITVVQPSMLSMWYALSLGAPTATTRIGLLRRTTAKWGGARRDVALCRGAMRGQTEALARGRLANGQSLSTQCNGSWGQTVGKLHVQSEASRPKTRRCTAGTAEPRQTGSPAVTVQRCVSFSVAQCTVGPVLRCVSVTDAW